MGRDVPNRRGSGRAEDRERPGAYHRIGFRTSGWRRTARTSKPPDLNCRRAHSLPTPTTSATNAVRHYRHVAGVRSTSPVRGHPLADPEKGSGIAMICTFGDPRTSSGGAAELPTTARPIIGWDGRIIRKPAWITDESGRPTPQSPEHCDGLHRQGAHGRS